MGSAFDDAAVVENEDLVEAAIPIPCRAVAGATSRLSMLVKATAVPIGQGHREGREHVLNGPARGVGDDVVDAADVVGDPGLQLRSGWPARWTAPPAPPSPPRR